MIRTSKIRLFIIESLSLVKLSMRFS